MKKEEVVQEFNYRLNRIEKEIENQQEEILRKINNLFEWQEKLNRNIKQFYEIPFENDRKEYLNQNNYGSIIDNLNGYIDYAKKLEIEIQKYNDLIHRTSIFEVNELQVKDEVERVINKSKTFSAMFGEEYNKLIRESSDFLKQPKEENLENISKIIKNISAENMTYEMRNMLNSSKDAITFIKKRAQSSLENNRIEINVNEENYDHVKVFNNSVEQPSYITTNPLGENRYFNINNGLRIPKVSLEEIMHHAYRAHNMSDGSHYSLNGERAFSDDEFVYQEFLSCVAFKMKENEPRLSMKLEGLHPNKKREMLEDYLNNVLTEITSNIKINNGQVDIPNYLLEASAAQYILRINGYDVQRTENIKEFFDKSSRGTLIEATPINERKFAKTFSENYKQTNLDDANIKKVLNDGRGINEKDFENVQKAKQRIEKLKELVISLQNEENFENEQRIIDEIDDFRINDLIISEYNSKSIYDRNIKFSDQLENFEMLINNNSRIDNLATKLIRPIYTKLSVNYSEKNKNVGADVKKELCETVIQKCEDILSATEQIINIYEDENKVVKTEEPIKEERIVESKIEQQVQEKKEAERTDEKEPIKEEHIVESEIEQSEQEKSEVERTDENESVKVENGTNNKNKKENLELKREIKELEEMIKKVLQKSSLKNKINFFEMAEKNYTCLAQKCTKEDYEKVLENFFEKAEDVVTKPSEITNQDIKVLGVYYGLTKIDQTKVGTKILEENNAEKIIKMLEDATKQINNIKK